MENKENWLLVQSGAQYHFLFWEDKGLYLAKIGRYRNRRLERMAKDSGFSQEIAKAFGVGCQEIARDALRAVAFGGIEKGDPIYLYPASGSRRTIFLAEEVDAGWLDTFFADVPRFEPPMDKRKRKNDPEFWRKEGQDPEVKRILKCVPWILSFAGVVCAAAYMKNRTPMLLLGCLVCLLIPVILVIAMPAYFTFMERPRKKQKSYGIPLSAPVLLIWFLMTPVAFNYNARDQWKILGFAVLLTFVVGLLLLCAEEFRRDKWNLWVLVVVFLFGIGTVCAVNETLDTAEPEIQSVQVRKLEHRRRTKGVDSFYCTILLPDGTVDRLEVSGAVYRALAEGDAAQLTMHPGALGIPYQRILP